MRNHREIMQVLTSIMTQTCRLHGVKHVKHHTFCRSLKLNDRKIDHASYDGNNNLQ